MDDLFIKQITLSKPPQEPYLHKLPVIQYMLTHPEGLSFTSRVTFLVGENGTGKSTLMEGIAIAAGFNPEGGTKNFQFSTRGTHSQLHECIRIARVAYPKDGFFLRAESFYNVASNIDELDEESRMFTPLINSYGGTSLHQQSHGESFLALVQNRFSAHGLYLLDEPEAALSPSKLMTLMVEIHELEKQGCQFIIATHSPILMTYPNAHIFELNDQGIHRVSYQETEHYQITRRFLEDPQRMLKYLWNDDIEKG